VAEGRVTRFQAAHVSPEEIQEVVSNLSLAQEAPNFSPVRPVALPWPVNRLTEALEECRQ